MAPTHQRLKLAWNFFFFFFFVLSINKWSSSSTYAVSLKFFCIAIYYRSFRDSLVRSLAYAEHNNEMFKFIFQHFLFLLSARAIPWAVLWLFLSFLPSFLDLSPRASVSDSVNSLNRDSLQPSDVRGASRAFFFYFASTPDTYLDRLHSISI